MFGYLFACTNSTRLCRMELRAELTVSGLSGLNLQFNLTARELQNEQFASIKAMKLNSFFDFYI